MSERRGRIHEKHELSKTRRCELLDVPRSSAYYRGEPASEADLAVMRLIDEIYLQWPFYGSRRMRDELEERGHTVNRKRVQRLMRQMDLRALYPRRRTSQPGKGHKIYPYLLRDLSIERANQAWASDISYIPMAKGFMYLVAIMDWYSRRVLSWRVSNTLDTDFCIEALEDALQRFEAPEIFNTDQGCQFTSDAFTDVLKGHAIAISMDGKGRWVDNVFVERLWRSVKYEDVYLRAYETPTELRQVWPATSVSTTPGAVTAHWTDAPRMRCTSIRLTAIWQPETRGRFHLPHCPIPGVHFSLPQTVHTFV